MKSYLKLNSNVVATFEFSPHLGYFEIYDLRIIDETKTPFSWRLMNRLTSENDKILFLENWIRQRMIPDYRFGLDEYVQESLQTHAPGFGRMHGYQCIPATLSFFFSPFDQYSIEPQKETTLFFGLEDERFENIYRLYPNQNKPEVNTPCPFCFIANEKMTVCEEPIRPIFPNFDTTIHSTFQSWIERTNGRTYLKQRVSMNGDDSYEHKLVFATSEWKYHYVVDQDYVRMDITDVFTHGNSLWLQELVPYLNPSSSLERQMTSMCQEIFGTSQPVTEIFNIYRRAKTCRKELSLSECGIVSLDDKVFPLIIL